jgi:hypothetical protein
VRADVSGAAGDENLHSFSLGIVRHANGGPPVCGLAGTYPPN